MESFCLHTGGVKEGYPAHGFQGDRVKLVYVVDLGGGVVVLAVADDVDQVVVGEVGDGVAEVGEGSDDQRLHQLMDSERTTDLDRVLVPGEDVFAGIRIDHGSKLGDHDPVGLAVLFVSFALQELAPVGHLTCNEDPSSNQPPPTSKGAPPPAVPGSHRPGR